MDTTQAVLLLVIIALTVLLIILGIQVYFILRELRATVAKANKVLDDAGIISESVSGPVATLSALITGVKTGTTIANFFSKGSKRRRRDDDGEEE